MGRRKLLEILIVCSLEFVDIRFQSNDILQLYWTALKMTGPSSLIRM